MNSIFFIFPQQCIPISWPGLSPVLLLLLVIGSIDDCHVWLHFKFLISIFLAKLDYVDLSDILRLCVGTMVVSSLTYSFGLIVKLSFHYNSKGTIKNFLK
jgi:hypothetical protein